MAKARSRKAGSRKKSSRKHARVTSRNGSTFNISEPKPTDEVAFAARAKRGTIYQPIIDKMASLSKNQSIVVDLPKGVTPKQMYNRLNATVRRYPVEAPKGCKFRRNVGENNTIIISCVPA